MNYEEYEDEHEKTQSRFAMVIKRIFVHNIGWKLLALFGSALIWILAAGLW